MTPAPYPPYESDTPEALRAVYGDEARFSTAGLFTLVHLDSPTPEVIARRTAEFDPSEFFVDDCPLCVASREQGGHIVFSGEDERGEEKEAPEMPVYGANPLRTPAVALLRALDGLDVAVDTLLCELEPCALPLLITDTVHGIGYLHDRLIDAVWSEDEDAARWQAFEVDRNRALATLDAVSAAHPSLSVTVARVREALAKVETLYPPLIAPEAFYVTSDGTDGDSAPLIGEIQATVGEAIDAE